MRRSDSSPTGGLSHFQRSFLSGGLTGIIEICITYPFEFIKSSLQVQPGRYSGPLHALRSNVRAHGWQVLYRGSPSWLLFAFPKVAIRFTSFDAAAQALATLGLADADTGQSDLARDVGAGLAAGSVEAVTCLAPCQNISIKMTHDANLCVANQRYPRFFPGVAMICREVGVAGMLAGVGPVLVKNSVNYAIRFSGFRFLAQQLRVLTGE